MHHHPVHRHYPRFARSSNTNPAPPAPPAHSKRNVLRHLAQCAARPIVNMSLGRVVAMRSTSSPRPSAGTAPPLMSMLKSLRYSAPTRSLRDVRDHVGSSDIQNLWSPPDTQESRSLPDTQHHRTAARQDVSTHPLKAITSASDMQHPGCEPQDAKYQTVARRMRKTPNRGPLEAKHQAMARRRCSTKPWPAGCAAPNRGP